MACVLVTVAVLAVLFRPSLRGRYVLGADPPVAERVPLVLATAVCALLGPAFLLGVDVLVVAATAAAIVVLVCAVARPVLLTWRLVPWRLVLGVSLLFVAVQCGHDPGLGALLGVAAGTGTSGAALLRLAGLAAAGANALDNLPTYLALAHRWGVRAAAGRAAPGGQRGVEVSWSRFALRGLVLVPLLLLTAVTALWLTHR